MTQTREVMVVEENAAMRNFLYASARAAGCDVVVAESAQDAIRRFRASRPDAVILSMGAARPARTLRAISLLHAVDPAVPIIVIAGHSPASTIAQALDRGAVDFVTVPFDEADVQSALAKALKDRSAGRERERGRDRSTSRGRLVGSSQVMEAVRQFIDRAAATDVNVLIRGESGTGKTLVAREIVAASPRWNQPFVKVNCAARTEDLANAELLALGPGEFGGALTDLGGKFACADGGTLFLDEIDEMSLPMQARLLKVLQERESSHLGVRAGRRPDVRIIASSSADLERALTDGRLREELYFRLNVLSLRLPPLRERREDIPELARHFLSAHAAQYSTAAPVLAEATMGQLMAYDWPGNVRELENLIRRLVVLGGESTLAVDLPGRGAPARQESEPATAVDIDPAWSVSLKERARLAAREAERALIIRTLELTNWNRKQAAARLGISYKALLKKMKECDLQNT